MSKEMLNKIKKRTIKDCTIIQVFLLVAGMIIDIMYKGKEDAFFMMLNVVLGILVLEVVIIGIAYLIYFIKNKEFFKQIDHLERDIPKEIPPAIASVLVDFYVDDEQDYLSTVSSLISRGYIEIVGNKEIIIKNNNIEGLLEHEVLAFKIVSKKAFYNSEEFRDKTIQDAKKLGLIERTNRFIMKWKAIGKCILDTIILLTISVIGAAMPEMLEGYEFISPLAWIVFGIVCVVYVYKIFKDAYTAFSYNSPSKEQSLMYIYKKTKKGEKYADKFAGLRLFLKEYTLMNERELESIKIYEDYIPYAIALGEADAITKFIEYDEDCRRLIYRV